MDKPAWLPGMEVGKPAIKQKIHRAYQLLEAGGFINLHHSDKGKLEAISITRPGFDLAKQSELTTA